MQVFDTAMIFYTRQSPKVLQQLQCNGRYIVDEAYIRLKYTTITEHYASLYRRLTLLARSRMDIPEDLLYPVWLSPEGSDLIPESEDDIFLKLDIPEGYYIMANNEVWDYMINHLYYPSSKEDEMNHEAELARYNISSPSSLINGSSGNFHPLLRQKVIRSWDSIFTEAPADPADMVGLCWELRREWLL